MNTIAIIPAFNEEKTIGNVLSVLQKVAPPLDRIIVVSDGSTDKTVQTAQSFGVEVVALAKNRGKGAALKAGLDNFSTDIVLLLDADLIGLTPAHVHSLLEPVRQGEADMTVGIFEKGRIATDLAQKLAPYLSGQRAIRSSLLAEITDLEKARYGVDLALSRFTESAGLRVKEVILPDMTHVMKEEKLGVYRGLVARMKMYWEIIGYLSKFNSLK